MHKHDLQFHSKKNIFAGYLTKKIIIMDNKNWPIIQQHLDCWKNKDFSKAAYATDLHFKGPLDEFRKASDFTTQATTVSQIVTDIVILQKFVEGDNAATLYNFVTNTPVGIMRIAEFYQLKNGKITSIETIFDPRATIALMEQMSNQKH